MFVTIVNGLVAFLSLFVELKPFVRGYTKKRGITMMSNQKLEALRKDRERMQLLELEADLVVIATSGPKQGTFASIMNDPRTVPLYPVPGRTLGPSGIVSDTDGEVVHQRLVSQQPVEQPADDLSESEVWDLGGRVVPRRVAVMCGYRPDNAQEQKRQIA